MDKAPVGSLKCRCGTVRVDFATATPRYTINCACVDCYTKNEWSCKQQGIDVPEGLSFASGFPDKTLTLCYFDNAMIVSDKSKLEFNKLRKDANSTNCIASCCSTVLFVNHPSYRQHQVLVFPEFIQRVNIQTQEPLYLVFSKDWPDEHREKLPTMPEMWLEGNQMTGKGAWEEASQVSANCKLVPPRQNYGETFNQLLDSVGGPAAVKILNLPEPKRSARLKE
eukprot:m.10194 g.10194  ORF g.10194 m.10194 type:complete len:224 (-) comp8175_c0_seq1:140-811(-)